MVKQSKWDRIKNVAHKIKVGAEKDYANYQKQHKSTHKSKASRRPPIARAAEALPRSDQVFGSLIGTKPKTPQQGKRGSNTTVHIYLDSGSGKRQVTKKRKKPKQHSSHGIWSGNI